MKLFNFNISNVFGRTLLWFLSAVLLILIMAQISLWIGIKWLNTRDGGAWAQNKINSALQNSEYKIAVDGFHYRPLTAIKIGQLVVSDTAGILTKIEGAKLSVNLSSLLLKQLSFSLGAEKIALLRLPQAKENTDEAKPLQPFSFPDIYFNKISIANIDIQNLEISKNIAGQAINLSPRISGGLSLSRNLAELKLNISPDARKITSLKNLPDRIVFEGDFHSENLLFTLRKLALTSSLYQGSAKGSASLANESSVDFSGTLESKNLADLNPRLEGEIDAKFTLSGTLKNLSLTTEGTIDLEELKKHEFTPVQFSIQSDILSNTADKSLQAVLSINSSYQELPILLGTRISKRDGVIMLQDIEGSAPDIKLRGALKITPDTTLMDGDLLVEVSKFEAYKNLIGADIEGAGSIKLSLSPVNEAQKAVLDLNIKNLKTGDILLNKANASVTKSDAGYALKVNGEGAYQKPFSFTATTNLVNLTNPDLLPKAEDIRAVLTLDRVPLNIAGSVDTKNIDIKIDTKNLSLGDLPAQLPDILNNMTLSGSASAQGVMSSPIIKSNITFSPLSLSNKAPDVYITLDGEYNSGAATLNLKGQGTGIDQLQGVIKTPIQLSLNPFVLDISNETAVAGTVNLLLQTKEIAESLLPPQYNFSGFLKSQLDIIGTLKKPILAGNATLKDGTFSDDATGMKLKNITLAALLKNDKIMLQNLSARDDKDGELTAAGYATLENHVLKNTDFDLTLKNYHLIYEDMVDGILNADINFGGTPAQYTLSGTIKSDDINVTIPEQYSQSIPELNIVEKDKVNNAENILKKIALDLQYIADNRIFVRGWGLDAEFGGKVSIKGNLDNPQFDGRLQSSRGRYEEFGKRFTITKANLNFLGSIPPTPSLDITAETKADDVTAKVNLTGSINDPKIGFSSTPALPEDEVLSRILFGSSLSTISPFQAIQLAQTLRRFSGKGGAGFDPLAKIREATGFDDLRVETNEEGEANVGVGKYLTDKVYLEFEKGTGENSGAANLQVEVTPNITVESELGQDTQGGAGVFWEWDY